VSQRNNAQQVGVNCAAAAAARNAYRGSIAQGVMYETR